MRRAAQLQERRMLKFRDVLSHWDRGDLSASGRIALDGRGDLLEARPEHIVRRRGGRSSGERRSSASISGKVTPSSSSFSTMGSVFQEKGVHGAFETDMKLVDLSFRQGEDRHASEAETLEDTPRPPHRG